MSARTAAAIVCSPDRPRLTDTVCGTWSAPTTTSASCVLRCSDALDPFASEP